MVSVFDGRSTVIALAQTPYWRSGDVIVSHRTVPEVFDGSFAVAYKIVRCDIHPRTRTQEVKVVGTTKVGLQKRRTVPKLLTQDTKCSARRNSLRTG